MATMTPFLVLDKSTNQSKRRRQSESTSSDTSASQSPCRETSSLAKISSEGGFTNIYNGCSNVRVLVFPTKKINPEQRAQFCTEFIYKLYNLNGDLKETKVNEIGLATEYSVKKLRKLMEKNRDKKLWLSE